MTADAKVGLLLGLLFIVVIAFLINGPAGFFERKKPVIETAVPAPGGRTLLIDQAVSEVTDQFDPPLRQTEPPEEVRVIDPTPAAAEVVSMQTSGVVQTAAADLRESTAVSAPVERLHVVQKGETLASIAVRYYGKEAGNKLATVRRLYEVNQEVLSSPDTIHVGDRLTIPPLEALFEPAARQPVKVEKGFLDKFKDLFEPVRASGASAGYREYVVQPGDRLWDIAEKYMGDGKRYVDLVKANRRVIDDPDHVAAGTVLKIPVQ